MVPFQTSFILFNYLQFLSEHYKKFIDCIVVNFLYHNVYTCLFFWSNNRHLVVSDGTFNMGMFWCILVHSVKILTCFSTACSHGIQVGTFIFIYILWWLERDKLGHFKLFTIIIVVYILYLSQISAINMFICGDVKLVCFKTLYPLTFFPVVHHVKVTIFYIIIWMVIFISPEFRVNGWINLDNMISN